MEKFEDVTVSWFKQINAEGHEFLDTYIHPECKHIGFSITKPYEVKPDANPQP